MEWLRPAFKFIRENPAILYSLVLIIVVPFFLFGFTFFLIGRFQTITDAEFKNKAFLTLTTLEAFSAEEISNPEALQQKAEFLANRSATVRSISFSSFNAQISAFKVIASSDKERLGAFYTETGENIDIWRRYKLAWGTENIIGAVVTPQDGERYWVALKSLNDKQGQKRALAEISLSLAAIDAQMGFLQQISLYVLIGITLILVLLVANHARLFEYAKLFRQQQEIDRMKDEFISIASHELKNPITGISNFLTLIKEGDYGKISSDLQKALDSVLLQADNLKNLVEDLLDVSRIQQGRLELDIKNTDIKPLLQKAFESFQIPAQEKGLELRLKIAPDLPKLKVDADRFQEIVSNLLSNAIKYTKQGWVELRAGLDERQKYIEIQVEDSGIGMSAREREGLFQKFYRIRPREAAAVPGTGLGLWISKNLVELMAGKVYVESIKGKGTRITLLFPVPQG